MSTDNDKIVTGTPDEEPGIEGLREGTPGVPSALGPEQDPDMGADMSDTGGAQWDPAIEAGGIQNEPGLEGLQQGTGDSAP